MLRQGGTFRDNQVVQERVMDSNDLERELKKMTTRELTLAALFVAVTAVLSQIVIPMPLVPFNLAVLAFFCLGAIIKKLIKNLCKKSKI